MKNFLFHKIWFEPMFSVRFFGSFYRCGSAAFSASHGGLSSPPVAAKTVRTISRIPHTLEKGKQVYEATHFCTPRPN